MKLVKHWRSHPAIINFANMQFYNSELQNYGDPAVTYSMLRSDALVDHDFPVVFHAVSGKDEQEEGSPSYFNIEEASLVRGYCEGLLSDRKIPLSAFEICALAIPASSRGYSYFTEDKDIGIISPYNGQCSKIRKLFGRSHLNLEGIKIGSVEEFQGQVSVCSHGSQYLCSHMRTGTACDNYIHCS